ncbi:hypothetical protein OAA60_00710 [Porticoccaceae bacterium]|nr:hypothetical protein [Porticoccaceae bacterium]
MGKKSSPPAPNYAAAAREQGAANEKAALQTAVLSNPNIYTPKGSQTTTWGQQGQGQRYNQTPWQNQSLAGGLYGGQQQPQRQPMTQQWANDFYAGNQGQSGGQQAYRAGGGQQRIPGVNSAGLYNSGNMGYLSQGIEDGVRRAGQQAMQRGGYGGFSLGRQGFGGQSGYVQGTPQATVQQHLSPTEQAKMDKNDYLDLSLLDTAQTGLGRVDNMMGTPFSMGGMQNVTMPQGSGGQVSYGGQPPQYQNLDLSGVAANGSLTTSGLNDVRRMSGDFGQIGDLNTQGLNDLSGIDMSQLGQRGQLSNNGLQGVNTVDPSQYDPYSVQASVGGLQSVTDAIRSRGDVDFSEQRRNKESELKARGFVAGTEGYETEMRELDRQQNDFNHQALLAGGQEQSRIAGLENTRRGQQLSEDQSRFSSEFANRGQQFGEQEAMAQFAQQLRSQGLNEQQVQAQVNSSNRNQEFGERQSVAGFQEQQRAARMGEQETLQQNDQALRGQGFAEQEAMAQFQQQLRQQGVSEQQIQAQMANQNASQSFADQGTMASFNQAEQQRQYQNQVQNTGLQQNERQRQIQEQAYLRQLPLNEMNALRTGTQAQLPQFQQYSGAQVAPAPLFQGAQAQGNFDLQANAQKPDVMGGLFQLGGAALGGGMFGKGGTFGK